MPVVIRLDDPRRVINVRADVDHHTVTVTLAEPIGDGAFWDRAVIQLDEGEALRLAGHLDRFAGVDTVCSFGPAETKGPRITSIMPMDVRLKLQFTNNAGGREYAEVAAHHALNLNRAIIACVEHVFVPHGVTPPANLAGDSVTRFTDSEGCCRKLERRVARLETAMIRLETAMIRHVV